MSRYIAVRTDDGVEVHVPEAGGNCGTLCGISIDDDEENGRVVPLDIGARINCSTCIKIVRLAKTYRERDFARPRKD